MIAKGAQAMTNMISYIKWRGDITLDMAGFNEVDSLILCRLSYVAFDGIVDASPVGNLTVGEAARMFLEEGREVLFDEDKEFLQELTESDRFSGMRISCYRCHTDEQIQKQFAAMTISLKKDLHYVAFRGTDNTLVGWREDFNMSYMMPVPSQTEAVAYLNWVADAHEGRLIVGGHSKGGNLAVYAAIFCDETVRSRIAAIYNNDGPGFEGSLLQMETYRRLLDRIHTYIPQTSVIGMLMERGESYTVVHSSQSGLMQHDMYSWEVMGTGFVTLEEVTQSSRYFDKTIKDWVAHYTTEEKAQFFDALFAVLGATQATRISEITARPIRHILDMVRGMRALDKEAQKLLMQIIRMLFATAARNAGMIAPLPGHRQIEAQETLTLEEATSKKA